MRSINSQDSVFIDVGTQYRISRKYDVAVSTAYDTQSNAFQTVSLDLRRLSASTIFGVSIGYNNITGSTSFGFLVRPLGARGGFGVRGVGDPNAVAGSRFGN